jgi:putative (di)nucleoside polyphosphate hydrolase
MSKTAGPADPSPLPYRSCVGIMLINPQGLIWVGRRRDRSAWQMPQGGIDRGEEPARAAFRELAEETGTGKAGLLAETRDWLHYDFPPHLRGNVLGGKYCGQRQKWFALRFTGEDSDFNIDAPPDGQPPEFDAWRWESAERVPQLIVPFKRNVYDAVIQEFRPFLR